MPDAEYLRQCFSYEPETGNLVWIRPAYKGRKRHHKVAGGRDKDGYIVINLDGTCYQAHRLIYKMIFNEEPYRIDHKDNNHSNNRIENLAPKERITKEIDGIKVTSYDYNHMQYKINRRMKKAA